MRWTARHDAAVLLVADDRLTNDAIAARVGIAPATLDLWKADAAFRDKVQQAVTVQREAAMSEAIAVKAERLRDYQELRRRLWSTIEANAQDHAAAVSKAGDAFGRDVPTGAAHGLMVKKLVPGGKGMLSDWQVDTALIAELRNLNKQAAQEMGDWTERKELSGKDGAPLQMIVFESSVPGLQPGDIARADAQIAALGTAVLEEGADPDGNGDSTDSADTLSP